MPTRPSFLSLKQGVAALHYSGVVACPTEAVWGLSCDPFDEVAVTRLLNIKRRSVDKGLILVAAHESQFDWLLDGLTQAQRARLALSWPGPTTWLVPHHNRVPPWIHGAHDTVAVRVSAHPVLSALSDQWGGPVVSTSANPSGRQAAVQAFQVRRYFGDQLDAIIAGSVGGAGRPTIIKHLESDALVRS